MKASKATSDLMAALSKAQGEFTNVKATTVNPFHNSKYAALDAVVDMYRPILAKHHLAITQGIVHRNDKPILSTRLSHKMGQWIEDDGVPLLIRSKDKHGKDVEPTMQGLMAATTYAKRLSSMSMLGIAATEEDQDGTPQSEWHGPLKKSALAAEARLLATAIQKAANPDQLKEVQVEFMDVIDQLRVDLPVWYVGDPAKDAVGLKDSIADKRKTLEEELLPSETVDDDEPII
jgi:hypothetical protein